MDTTILIIPVIIAATLAACSIASKVIKSSMFSNFNLENSHVSPSSTEFNQSLVTLCRMFPSIGEDQLKVMLIKNSGSLEQTISTILVLNAKKEEIIYITSSEKRSPIQISQSNYTWFDDPVLRHQSLQQRKTAALESARASYLEKQVPYK